VANMGYCRFENTLRDLRDCDQHMADDLDGDEEKARKALIRLCVKIADEQGQDADDA